MNIMTSSYFGPMSFVCTTSKRHEPTRAIEYMEMKTHLRLEILPLDDFIRDVDIFDSKIPPRRQPTKKLVEANKVC